VIVPDGYQEPTGQPCTTWYGAEGTEYRNYDVTYSRTTTTKYRGHRQIGQPTYTSVEVSRANNGSSTATRSAEEQPRQRPL
jgi:hypothetical protein